MRKPSHADAELLLKLYDFRREPEMRRARAWFGQASLERAEDVLGFYGTGSEDDRWLRMVITYWDMVAAMVNHGVLHEELFFDTNGEDIFTWRKIEPVVGAIRAKMRPTYLHNLESCATRHMAWRQRQIDAHNRRGAPGGRRGAGARRSPAARGTSRRKSR